MVDENMQGLTDKRRLKEILNDRDLIGLYMHINTINQNPDRYDREDMSPLKLVVWSKDGVTLSYNDLKALLGNADNVDYGDND